MATNLVGWAVDTDGVVLRTVDGGLHWSNVTPSRFQTYSLEPAAFLGEDEAWLVGPPEITGSLGGVSVAFHTRDGGRTWDEGGAVYQMEPGLLQMLDSEHGWFTTTGQCTSQCTDQGMTISSTVDGGQHWQTVMKSDPLLPVPPGAVPPRCGKQGPAFENPTTGWVTARCIGGKPFFFRTIDGGRTWTSQSLPPPPGLSASAFADCFCEIRAPTFITPSVGALTINVTGADSVGRSFWYSTADAGRSWTPQRLPQTVPAILDLLSPEDAYDLQGGNLYRTLDGGTSWTRVSSDPVLAGATIDFVSIDNGFALGSSMARTSDGGRHWTPVTPQLASNR
jgi:photosystem II stability/assembly factor-like uncharacterized protein